MDDARDDLRAEINDRLARLVGGAHSSNAAAPALGSAVKASAAAAARQRAMDSGPRSTRDSLVQMDTLLAPPVDQGSANPATAAELTGAASDDTGGQRSRPTSGASVASSKSTGNGGREREKPVTATGPLAKLLARRPETAVDRLASGKTTSHRRPGSATPTLTPEQLVQRRVREEEAAAAKSAERAANEARKLAKEKALAGDDSAEVRKKKAAKAAALAERAAPQQPVQLPDPAPQENESSSIEERRDSRSAERGSIAALAMAPSLTRRDRRVVAAPDQGLEPPMSGRSSHSNSSNSSSRSRRSKSSADSEAEEVKAKLDAVNERLARLGRK